MNRRQFFGTAAVATAARPAALPFRAIASHPNANDPKPLKPDRSRLRATAEHAMVSTSHPFATEAAVVALKKGGNAVDAYLTAALTQCVLEPVMTTLGGGLGVNFYEAASGRVFLAGGSFSDPEAEVGEFSAHDFTTGRTVMVPGYVAGVYGASQRFGRLSWEELFEPAIHYAREGFVIDHLLWGWTFEYRRWIGRYPEGREIWFPQGHFLSVGDILRQPKLATTLERIRDEGPEYFYQGEWSRNFVEAVRARGSRITQDDMTKVLESGPGYVVDTSVPRGQYREYEVVGAGHAMIVFALNLVEAGDLRSRGRPTGQRRRPLLPDPHRAGGLAHRHAVRSRYPRRTHLKGIRPSGLEGDRGRSPTSL